MDCADTPIQIIGYDPGGNGNHGVACLGCDRQFSICAVACFSASTTRDAIGWASSFPQVKGVGIDTLTRWATAKSGWRPADLWLRQNYSAVANSVLSPNTLSGSMSVNGMCFKAWASTTAGAVISETHPKVAFYAVFGQKHDWVKRRKEMLANLGGEIGHPGLSVSNDHEFDAVLSAYAVRQGMAGHWPLDLHELPGATGGDAVEPFGPSKFYWPAK